MTHPGGAAPTLLSTAAPATGLGPADTHDSGLAPVPPASGTRPARVSAGSVSVSPATGLDLVPPPSGPTGAASARPGAGPVPPVSDGAAGVALAATSGADMLPGVAAAAVVTGPGPVSPSPAAAGAGAAGVRPVRVSAGAVPTGPVGTHGSGPGPVPPASGGAAGLAPAGARPAGSGTGTSPAAAAAAAGGGDVGPGRVAPAQVVSAEAQARVLYVHFGPDAASCYPELLGLLGDITPVVQALPPDAALVDVRGAVRYFGRDAAELAALVRLRALARYGVDCTIGVAVNPLLARMAAGDGPPGRVRCVPAGPGEAAAFLAGKPAAALYGVGPATARTLGAYGLDTVGRIAAARPGTVQRVLGAVTGRRVQEAARGFDPTPVTPSAPAPSLSREYRFGRDELDADLRRRALLTLADELGFRMRTEERVARVLTLTVRCADRSTLTRTRRLAEPTAHTPALTSLAYALHDALGLQRARVRAVALRVEELTAAELAAHQLSLDPREENARRAEAAADRARLRFGSAAARPAGLLHDAA